MVTNNAEKLDYLGIFLTLEMGRSLRDFFNARSQTAPNFPRPVVIHERLLEQREEYRTDHHNQSANPEPSVSAVATAQGIAEPAERVIEDTASAQNCPGGGEAAPDADSHDMKQDNQKPSLTDTENLLEFTMKKPDIGDALRRSTVKRSSA